MAISAAWYGTPITNLLKGTTLIDFDTDTLKISLHTSAYVPNFDTHAFFSDVTNEVVGTGYTAGGITLATKAVTYDSATNENRISCANVSWTASTITARYAVIYKSTGVASTSPLICLIDFGADQSTSGGTFAINFDATGYAKIVS